MSSEKRLDSIGWKFFGVMAVLFLPPSIYLILISTYDTIHIFVRVGTGVFLAFFAAGFTSWVVNSILYYRAQWLDARAERPEPAERHAGQQHEGQQHEGQQHEGQQHEAQQHEGQQHEAQQHEAQKHEGQQRGNKQHHNKQRRKKRKKKQ